MSELARRVQRCVEQHISVVRCPELCSEPVVSVALMAFNHRCYIQQALESVLDQETCFPVEVVISDDCSTDGTREFILEYQKSCPDRLAVVLADQNLWGTIPGMNSSPTCNVAVLGACRGKYIAFLEGDDYWIDRQKLQRQVDYLEATPSAAACFHRSTCIDSDGKEIKNCFRKSGYQRSYTQSECMTNLGSSYATGSLMARRAAIPGVFPDYFLRHCCDELLDIVITENGSLDFLPDVMSAYRLHSGGAWQSASAQQHAEAFLDRTAGLANDHQIYHRRRDDVDALLRNRWNRLWRNYSSSLGWLPFWRTIRIIMVAHQPAFPIRLQWLLANEFQHLGQIVRKTLSRIKRISGRLIRYQKNG